MTVRELVEALQDAAGDESEEVVIDINGWRPVAGVSSIRAAKPGDPRRRVVIVEYR